MPNLEIAKKMRGREANRIFKFTSMFVEPSHSKFFMATPPVGTYLQTLSFVGVVVTGDSSCQVIMEDVLSGDLNPLKPESILLH